jgi:hypothetical protein
MPHQLIAIDETPLPFAMPEDDLSTGDVESGLVDSIGSAYNYWGASAHYPRKQNFTHRGLYEGDIDYRITSAGDFRVTSTGDYRVTSAGDYRVTSASKMADLRRKVDALKVKIGQWSKVWRKSYPDGTLTYKYCRLLHVEHLEDVEKAGVVAELQSNFETLDVGWRSASADVVTVTIAAGGSETLLVYNRGRYPVIDGILRITCTSGTITTVTIFGPQIDITWTGVLASGQALIIDSGSQIAPIGATDAYTGLTFGVGHTSAEWLPLAVGLAPLTVGIVGGAATVTLEHVDRWP